jgi:hypothetical protein
MGLERVPLSLVRITEKLLERLRHKKTEVNGHNTQHPLPAKVGTSFTGCGCLSFYIFNLRADNHGVVGSCGGVYDRLVLCLFLQYCIVCRYLKSYGIHW